MAAFQQSDWAKIKDIFPELYNLNTQLLGKIQEAMGASIVAAQKGQTTVVNKLATLLASLNGLKNDTAEISNNVNKYGADWVRASQEDPGLGFLDFLYGGMSSSDALSKMARTAPGILKYYKQLASQVDSIISTLTSTPARNMTVTEANALMKTAKRATQASMIDSSLLYPFLILAVVGGFAYLRSKSTT